MDFGVAPLTDRAPLHTVVLSLCTHRLSLISKTFPKKCISFRHNREHSIVLCVVCFEAQGFTIAEATWPAQEEAILWLSPASVDPRGYFLPLVFYER